jgi:hypothetical protein
LYQDRFLVFTHVYILIALAVLLSKVKPQFIRIPLIIIVCISFIYASLSYWKELDIQSKGGAHEAARYIFENKEEEDPIMVSSSFVFFAIDHYAREEFDGKTIPRLYSIDGEFSHYAGGPILTEEDMANPKDLPETGTVWMVDTTGFGGSKLPLPEGWEAQDEQTFPEVFSHQQDVFVTRYVK